MSRSKRFVLWLSEKLGVDLEEHFRNQIIPDDQEEFTKLIEEEFEMISLGQVQSFVSKWLEFSNASESSALNFVFETAEDFEIDLEERYQPQNKEELFDFLEEFFEHDLETREKEMTRSYILEFSRENNLQLDEYFRRTSPTGLAEMTDHAAQERVESEESDVEEELEFWKQVIDQSMDVELNDFDSNPVEDIYELEDDSGKLYLWKLPSEWSDQQRDNLFARLVTSYRENRDPKAAHLLLTELDELKDVDRDEMKSLLGHAATDL